MRTCTYLRQLSDCGVAFRSITEPLLDTSNELVRDILLAVLFALARQERQRISERTKAGLDRVRRHGSRSGKAIGRPMLDPALLASIREFRNSDPNMSANAIARLMQIDPKTVRKYL